MKLLLKQSDIDKEKTYAKAGGIQAYMAFYRHEPTFEGWMLRSKQQKARDFSHGMNASSYPQTRSIISMASV